MKSMLRILHLEDDPHDAELIQALLVRGGLDCEMVRVDTREDFLGALDREPFDLILADYRLPSFDGLTALSLVQERCPELPVILVSGTLGEELAIDSLKAGATDYVLKQRLSRLAPAVHRALREAEEREKRKQAEQTTKRLLDQQVVINQLALFLGEFRDLGQVYTTLYEQVRGLMDTDAFIISFFDEETQLIHARYVITQGTVRDVAHFPPIPLEKEGQGTQSQVLRTGESLYFPDWRQAMRNTQTEHMIDEDGTVSEGPPPPDEQEESTNSALLVPMKKAGKTIGVMQVQSHQLDGYTQGDIDLLSGLANSEANMSHLFAPFFTTKLSEGEAGAPRGTGLGLYTVQRLLEPYGAEIEVESVVDVGTTFRVKIPILGETQRTNHEGYRQQMGASIEKALEISAYTCLYKPLDIEALLQVLSDINRQELGRILGRPVSKRS